MNDSIIENLRNTLSKFELALGQIKEAIVFTSGEGKIQWCNKVFDDFINKPHIEILGQFISDLMSFDDSNKNTLLLSRLQNLKEKEFMAEYCNNGKIIQIVVHKMQLHDSSTTFVFVLSDITARKKREQITIQSQKLEAIGTLASGISHEMNTPIQYISDNIIFLKESMNDIIQFIEVIYDLTKKNEPSEVIHEKVNELYDSIDVAYLKSEVPLCLNQTQTGTTHIAKLVHSMKQFAHPGSKELVPVKLSGVVETVLEVTRHVWKNTCDIGINLVEQYDQVYSIQSELNQILMNLIVNACDAIVERYGSHCKKGEIIIYNQLSGNYIELHVKDNGLGIKEEIVSKIFDPFFTTKEVGKGTGQGLAMIYHSVTTRLKGNVNVVTKVGYGTTFVISLPKNME